MKRRFWNLDLSELADLLYDWVVKFWKENVWPLFMGFSFFFFLAIPLLIVMAVLWYLNEIHWAPEHGVYKIGSLSCCSAVVTSASLTSGAVVNRAAYSDRAAAPRSVRADIV